MSISKKQKTLVTTLLALLLMIATVPAAIWVTHTQSAELGNGRARCDNAQGALHTVVIQNDRPSPVHTEAKKCDTLRIVNMDGLQRLMAFGRHDNHISYDGVSEKLLSQGDSLEVRLITTGTYIFHDHIHDEVQGTFTVNK